MSDLLTLAEEVDPEDETKPDLKRPRDPGEDLIRCLLVLNETRADRPSDPDA
jgi:hypothetical protein